MNFFDEPMTMGIGILKSHPMIFLTAGPGNAAFPFIHLRPAHPPRKDLPGIRPDA